MIKEILDLANQGLTEIKEIPEGVKMVILDDNKIKKLPKLPDSLERLDCENNELVELPELPAKVKWVCCSNNKIKKMPKLPEGMLELHCVNNPIEEAFNIPDELCVLEMDNVSSAEYARQRFDKNGTITFTK